MKCSECKEEVDEVHRIKVEGRNRRVCEDCLGRLEEEGAINEEALAAVKDMMGYKGGW